MLQLPHEPVVAIIGATGAVGREMLAILEERAFPMRALRLFASPRSKGLRIPFRGGEIACETLEDAAAGPGGGSEGGGSLAGIDLALLSAGK